MPSLRLFDTTYLIDLINGDEGAVKKAGEVDVEDTFKAISIVTAHEYLRGVYHLHMHEKKLLESKLGRAEAELSRFEVIPYTYDIAKVAAKIDAILISEGISISLTDIIIAATALHYKLTLVTRNIDHFKRIPELNIETY
ncbi:MAG: type II toxin-antitoxin system VapC family toxin [Candidatus Bathyarchaeia archaeon]